MRFLVLVVALAACDIAICDAFNNFSFTWASTCTSLTIVSGGQATLYE